MVRAILLTPLILMTAALGFWGSANTAHGAPALQLPWPTGHQHRINAGNTYNCDTHDRETAGTGTAYNADKYAIDFQFGSVDGSPLDVAAVAAGTVVQRANYNDGYGNKVVVGHGGGFYSVYAHFRDGTTWGPGIVPGAFVSQGQLLGYAGGTGRDPPYPVHLHMHMQSGLSAYRAEPMSESGASDGTGFPSSPGSGAVTTATTLPLTGSLGTRQTSRR